MITAKQLCFNCGAETRHVRSRRFVDAARYFCLECGSTHEVTGLTAEDDSEDSRGDNGMTVYVVTQGCGYGGARDTVIGVRYSRDAAERFAAEVDADPHRSLLPSCPGEGAKCVVSEQEVKQ